MIKDEALAWRVLIWANGSNTLGIRF